MLLLAGGGGTAVVIPLAMIIIEERLMKCLIEVSLTLLWFSFRLVSCLLFIGSSRFSKPKGRDIDINCSIAFSGL